MLHQSDFDLQSIGMQKTAVFLILPEERTTVHFLVGLFVKQCYECLIDLAQSTESGELPIRTNILLDELANIPTIPDIGVMLTASRSRNVRFYLFVQSLKPLFSKYGEDTAESIFGNCANIVFLHSREDFTLEKISTLCGNDEKGNPLFSKSMLTRLSKEKKEVLVINDRNFPYVANMLSADEYPFEKLPPVPLVKRERREIPFDINDFEKKVLENLMNEKISKESSIISEGDDNSGIPEEIRESLSSSAKIHIEGAAAKKKKKDTKP